MSDGGYIYAIGIEGGQSVKIGKTAGPVAKRLAALQIGQPVPLRLLAYAPVDTDIDRIEKAIHHLLVTDRQRGEWFTVAIDQAVLEALILRAAQWLIDPVAREGERLVHIGERVRRLRTERGLTQTELAERAHVSQAVISRLEADVRRNVNADVLKALARALGCTTDYLVGMHEEEESELVAAGAC